MTENDTALSKILICGDVAGNIDFLFKRIEKIQKKSGKFDMLFCLGDFLGNNSLEIGNYINGNLKAPIPTFILSPLEGKLREIIQDDGGSELCPNITYLGRRGVYNHISGIRVAYLSALEPVKGRRVMADGSTPLTAADVAHLMSLTGCEEPGYAGVDLFLTPQWPSGVENLSEALPQDVSSQQFGSSLLAKLALLLKPRYHFVAHENLHYERYPYRNHKVAEEKERHPTRFIALAKVKNTDNAKYLYAIQIMPMSKMDSAELSRQPMDVTESPYSNIQEEIVEAREIQVQTEQFFFDKRITLNNKRKRKEGSSVEQKLAKKPRQYSPCWFCLGNPKVETHLVVSVGMHAYLAMPRGPLTNNHLLILPVGHHQSSVVTPTDVNEEIELYKKSIRKMYKDLDRAMLIFERNLKSHHLQLQVVDVPISVAGECKRAFIEEAKKMLDGFEFQEIPSRTDLREVVAGGIPYFFVELPNKEKLFARIHQKHLQSFDLQFGRRVLANRNILNCPDRVDWHKCAASHEEETKLTLMVRELYADYDFNND